MADEAKPGRGRPTDYTVEMGDIICERLACGESLRRMCLDDDSLPCERTVYRWLIKHDDFSQNYTRAREFQSECRLEDMIEIADNPKLEPHDKRVRIDTRKWINARLTPKKYGDRSEVRQIHDLSEEAAAWLGHKPSS